MPQRSRRQTSASRWVSAAQTWPARQPLVLFDDDFTSIVRAVRLGRRIFDNLCKAIGFLLAVHVPIAGLSVLPVLVGWPLILLPVHIVFLELIIDPACSIAFESEREERNIMCRPPRSVREPLFDRRTVVFSLLQGLGVSWSPVSC
jgi:Ca2+-transporting ATPase